jgi:DNA modification methylase
VNIEFRDPASLTPHPRNSRLHSSRQIAELARAMQEFGITQPVVITPEGVILVGHARTLSAISLGLKQIPVTVAEDMPEQDQRALVIADNALHEFGAGWNEDLLGEELHDLMGKGIDVSITGFDPIEPALRESMVDEDAAPPVPEVAVSKHGMLWALGDHRLVVGDSTDPVAVALALGGAKPQLMVTDPPYGVEYDPSWRNEVERANGTIVAARATGKVLNDDNADWSAAWALFPGALAYVWHAAVHAPTVAESLEAAGFGIGGVVVWAKGRHTISRGAYHWQHEPCLWAKRGAGKIPWHSQGHSDLWEIGVHKFVTNHGTQKPVEAMRRPMVIHTHQGEHVYDPFLGSGTTLIAAHTCARICHGIELDPRYADVAIERWQGFTGRHAHAITPDGSKGPTFFEMKGEP